MDTEMFAGVVCGIIVGIILVVILLKITKTNGKIKCEFDERQEMIRGRGFKYGFYTLLIYDAVYGVVDLTVEKPYADNLLMLVIGIAISVVVYAGYAIWHESYFALNESPRKFLIAFAAVAVINLAIAGINAKRGILIQEGQLTWYGTNLVAGIMFLVIMLVLGVKLLVVKKEADS